MFGRVAYAISIIGSLVALALRVLNADATPTFAVSAVAIGGLAYRRSRHHTRNSCKFLGMGYRNPKLSCSADTN